MIAVRIAGSGGQGIQRAGVVLAEAAIRSGLNAACAHSYGPESRGGASRCDVIVSEGEILYPRVRRPDILIVLSKDAFRQFAHELRPGGTMICDSAIAGEAPVDAGACYTLPISATAKTLGSALTANVVALGVLCAVKSLASREALEAALDARIRADAGRTRRALLAGIALAGTAPEAEGAAS